MLNTRVVLETKFWQSMARPFISSMSGVVLRATVWQRTDHL